MFAGDASRDRPGGGSFAGPTPTGLDRHVGSGQGEDSHLKHNDHVDRVQFERVSHFATLLR